MELEVECECGWSYRGPTEELVTATMNHARAVHQLVLTREQVLAAARPAVTPAAGSSARAEEE